MNLFLDVFTWANLSWAVAAGLVIGATALLWLSLAFPPLIPLSTSKQAILTVAVLLVLGSVYWVGQLVPAIFFDPLWPRIFARYALWDVYSIATAIGLTVARHFAGPRVD